MKLFRVPRMTMGVGVFRKRSKLKRMQKLIDDCVMGLHVLYFFEILKIKLKIQKFKLIQILKYKITKINFFGNF